MTIGYAERCTARLAVDAFVGVGGNAVQLARTCAAVVGVDHNLARLQLAAHNAAVYGCTHQLELLCANFFTVASGLQVCAAECCYMIALHCLAIGPYLQGYLRLKHGAIDCLPVPSLCSNLFL